MRTIEARRKMSKHYIAVADVQEFIGYSWEEIKAELGQDFDPSKPYDGPKTSHSFRWFGDKFVKDPLMAIFDTAYPQQDWYDKKVSDYFISGLRYDPESKVYVFNSFTTIGLGLEPKDWHYEKFFKGEDEFALNYWHYDIQLLSTEVETLPPIEVVSSRLPKTGLDFLREIC